MPNFVWHVPNGANIPEAPAIGHVMTDFPRRNVFGQDFESAGLEWTKELCETDSDKDGQTNGQELGDPCCEWTIGSSPAWSSGISHPGDATKTSDPARLAAIRCISATSESESAPELGHAVHDWPERNAFGQDFDDAGRRWSVKFCQSDSDGDGQTNGQELGDPCCEWDEISGGSPLWSDGLSHPGDPDQTADASRWESLECAGMKEEL
ncbi:unnamed protein product [Phytophthora lilii]|uniref:Unnamed protein product n=1 Tax=Phytophthora lilii TaxID=2077276 RepID=A0A9W6X032_9STRA|nr:unnamed protein product [Phytophthora lilii]